MAKERRTQERAVVTRGKLLDATIDSLLERGYAGTTTTVIAERAGLSRGAQLHHFPTKAELVLAALEHLATRLGADLQRQAAKLPTDGDRTSAVIDLIWSRFATPLFPAWLELKVAARTDEELRARLEALEKRLATAVEVQVRHLFGEEAARSDTFAIVSAMTLYLFEGIAMNHALSGSRPGRSRRERELIAAWKRIVEQLL